MQYNTVFFLHLPKTGGMTMRRVLDREYRHARRYEIGVDINDDIRRFRAQRWTNNNVPNLVQGHMSFGLHELVPGPSTYITVLRDPVRRALSDYHYVTSTPDHPIYEHVKKLSLREYFDSGITGQLSNGMVRLLSGDHLPDDPGVPGHGRMGQKDLGRARENLKNHFAVAGLQERFDETLLLFRRRLGWGWPFYSRQNVTTRGYSLSDIDPADLEHIRELNSLDIELYESVREDFDVEIAREGAAMRRDETIFRTLKPGWEFLATHLPPSCRVMGSKAWYGIRSLRRVRT